MATSSSSSSLSSSSLSSASASATTSPSLSRILHNGELLSRHQALDLLRSARTQLLQLDMLTASLSDQMQSLLVTRNTVNNAYQRTGRLKYKCERRNLDLHLEAQCQELRALEERSFRLEQEWSALRTRLRRNSRERQEAAAAGSETSGSEDTASGGSGAEQSGETGGNGVENGDKEDMPTCDANGNGPEPLTAGLKALSLGSEPEAEEVDPNRTCDSFVDTEEEDGDDEDDEDDDSDYDISFYEGMSTSV